MSCLNIDGDLGHSVLGDCGLELGHSGQGGPGCGRDIEIVEDGSEVEGSSGQKLTSGKLNVAEADFGKVECGGR